MEFRYRYGGEEFTVQLEPQPGGGYVARIDGREMAVSVQRSQPGQLNFTVDGERVHAYTANIRTPQTGTSLHFVALADREACVFEVEKVTGSARRGGTGRTPAGGLTAQMPGQVMEVFVKEGERVEAGQPLLLLEAMKMEMRVTAPADGIVTRLLVEAGQAVERGQQLAEVTAE